MLLLTWAGFFFGNIPFVKDKLWPRDDRDHRGVTDPGGLGGIEEVSNAYRSFAHRVEIGVPVERAWRAFTDSRVLERWTAAGASITPREKGRLHVVFSSDMELRRTHRRAGDRATHAPDPAADPRHADPDAVIVEDFLFERTRHQHRGPFAEQRSSVSSGLGDVLSAKRRHWELALTRLKVFLEKGLDLEQPPPRY